MLKYFTQRQHRDEWMDQPDVTRDEFEQALTDIQWVNQNLSGSKIIIDEINRLILEYPAQSRYAVLDLGTGSADIPRALCDWGRRHGIAFSVMGVDSHPVAVDVSAQLSESYPEINIEQADALHLPYPDGSFDFVICSMFLHHMTAPEARQILSEMRRLSRLALIVNDLERHPLAWLGITVLGSLFNKGAMFRHDAPLSVLNGFTLHELREMANEADLFGALIHRRLPYRLVLVYPQTQILTQSAVADDPAL